MNRQTFVAGLREAGFEDHPAIHGFTRASDGAQMTYEFVEDLVNVWGDVQHEAVIEAFKNGAKRVGIVVDQDTGTARVFTEE